MIQLRNLRRFYDLLVDHGADGVSLQDAADALAVSVKSIYRYPKYLEVLFGGEVVKLRKGAFYLLDDAAFLASLGRDELQALTVARKLLSQIGMPFEREFEKLGIKLERARRDGFEAMKTKARDFTVMKRKAESHLAFVEPHLCRDVASARLITDLYRWSLEEPRPMIRFAYRSLTTPEQPERRIYPLGLVFKNAWFLVGYDPARESRVRVYAVDRMGEPVRLDLPQPLRDFGFDVSEHFAHAWRLLGGGQEPRKVVFRLRKKASEERKHASWMVEEVDDEWLRVSVQVSHPEEMIPYLLSQGADVRVLEPQALREEVWRQLSEAIAFY